MLSSAAMLYEVGDYGPERTTTPTYYIIANSEILGTRLHNNC